MAGRIESWEPYQQGNLSTVKYCVLAPWRMPLPQFQAAEFLSVIPGRAKREPGIHFPIRAEARWIPGSTLRVAPE
ncbi:hypothetical protein [Bradyrhizobium sp. CCBAU 11357]|uniref:hypothetical protein n=1 Tax=Bradyrhizobium sp. CCBAU 11357 TaxID=1630808 RepID=UPI0023043F8C|nr:hypothetical protein [Bradyrhizobium sp. CCBAU 11357]